jgi:tight adherence protein B
MGLEILAAVLAFVAVAALVLALTSPAPGRRVEQRLTKLSQPAERTPVGNVLRIDSGTFPLLRRIVTGTAWSERAARDLDRAGITLKVSEYLMLRILLAVVAALVAVLFIKGSVALFVAICAGVIGFMVPAWYLAYRRARRQSAINSQLVETLSLLSNSLRSGFAFTQAIELAAKQMEPPIQDELNRVIRDTSLGMPLDEALQEMADRSGSYDLDMVVATILIQRTTGGNLSEILDNVAETVRERERLQNEIRALTASQRLTGTILSFYPLGLAFLLFLIQPDLMSVLFENEVGRVLLVIAAVLMGLGIFSIRRILRLEV